ncbi:hypothetical protein Q4Q34_15465 [Flavivirga abyssicola]|uniref:hypothetical protein n=1 Tax=Flavivirga abyssicola TaxID=3063533 RepID=UPI0026E05254|nr:hypothetical protein [Flavivirga sp. MEBiC07777]WVK12615.1 hypothetical protein Q4Q34_15465 [Flavivirga sp. MEBiC07777]
MNHQHWFTIRIEHQYFYNNECDIFELLPMHETRRIMKNYGIRFQKLGHQYYAYAVVAPSKKIWEELQRAEDLYFQLINTDQNFDNYTNVNLPKKEGSVLYITNSEVTNTLKEEETVSPLPLETRPLRFNVKASITETTSVIIKNSKGQDIFSQQSLKNQSDIPIDISAFGAGIYQLWIDGSLTSTFFGTSQILHTNCYGILHIQMRNIQESLKENTIPSLKVNFESRATFWEYVVIVPKDKKIEIQNMSIESVDSEEYKTSEKKIILGNQEASHVFTSTNAIKLNQKPEKYATLKIRYTNQFSDTLQELDMKMPVPGVSSIITENENNENLYYSQTIIYV